ncbi:TetR family transcriptional regulator [Candidatus Enterococcus mangumiae]|uniref:HTH tetR-type domain-containing protein n=1 Tax=Candidatus Enterococcus mangumiae TaxID=2230878 RepID=A0ABZ2T0V2_9ENTE|nr:TetR family transcriptional regulator [Enterococcus sp. DIV1094]MBO0489025.1 TetR family transcriptional regulator [Enterococcus sp. DIV1094]
MPKETFFNISKEKQQWILEILLDKFYDRHISQVKVSEIVEAMEMSRGAFYKYFQDLEDAYTFTVRNYSNRVHGDIIASINRNRDHFFLGIEEYLAWCGGLSKDSPYWRSIKLLTRASDLGSSKRLPTNHDSSMVQQWLDLLKINQISMDTTEEAISFLYFVMALVMNSLTDYMVNQWTAEELIEDFRYKVKWLEIGIKSKNANEQ